MLLWLSLLLLRLMLTEETATTKGHIQTQAVGKGAERALHRSEPTQT